MSSPRSCSGYSVPDATERTPAISVIIPAFNVERYIRQALESVLDQTWTDYEILVVDDGSTDGTAIALAPFLDRIRYFRTENKGSAAARNLAIGQARAGFFAFLDGDDFWVREKLERQMEQFRRSPDTEAVFGGIQQFISPDVDPASRDRLVCPETTLPGTIFSSLVIRREAFFKVGWLSPEYGPRDFADWYSRMRSQGIQTVILPELTAFRRLHSSNQGLQPRDSFASYTRVIREHLHRQRARSTQVNRD